MIHFIAKNTVTQMINNNIVSSKMAEVYQYGLELLLSTVLTTLSILGLACSVDSFLYGMLYLMISIPLRMTAGGYHASTYAKCFVTSNLSYLAVSMSTRFLSELALPYPIWLIILSISTCYIWRHCPVRNPHHPVKEKILQKNRHYAIGILCIDYFLLLSLYIKLQQSELLNLAVVTILSVALFMIPTTQKKRRENL